MGLAHYCLDKRPLSEKGQEEDHANAQRPTEGEDVGCGSRRSAEIVVFNGGRRRRKG